MSTEAKVGLFVLSSFALLAFTVVYLLNAQFGGGTVPYRTYLRYAGGLQPGASMSKRCGPGPPIQRGSRSCWKSRTAPL